jgi:cytochrome c oxidase assembly protein Cox11
MIKHNFSALGALVNFVPMASTLGINVRMAGESHNDQKMKRTINLVPGETSLSFFKASNPTKDDIVGISTYRFSN